MLADEYDHTLAGVRTPSRKPFIRRDPHYEADIHFSRDPNIGLICIKKYRKDVDCISWLNDHLSKYYPSTEGLPVAQHEYAALTLLEKHKVAPRPIAMLGDAVAMEFAGRPVSPFSIISADDYKEQCLRILTIFEGIDFRHNDMLASNVLIHRGKVKLIDFTLSEFAGIDIARSLPQPGWARLGQDGAITGFLAARRRRLLDEAIRRVRRRRSA